MRKRLFKVIAVMVYAIVFGYIVASSEASNKYIQFPIRWIAGCFMGFLLFVIVYLLGYLLWNYIKTGDPY